MDSINRTLQTYLNETFILIKKKTNNLTLKYSIQNSNSNNEKLKKIMY